MLIPRYSLRWLLALTTVCAVFSLVVAEAVRGQPWAIGVTGAVAATVVLIFLYIAAFLAAWAVTQLTNAFAARFAPASPFRPGSVPTPSPFAPIEQPVIAESPESPSSPISG